MKKSRLYFGIVAAVFLCGCAHDLQTMALITPALTLEPTATVTELPIRTPSPTPAMIQTKTADPFAGEFWCELYAEDTERRMTLSEIAVLNEQSFRAKGTGLVKLSELERITASQVLEMIASYSFPKMKYYGNEVLSEKTKAEILKLRNLDALQNAGDVELKYGILIQNADLRSFPAEKPLTAEQNGCYDYLQETVLYLNEAVAVLHTSADGAWCFVQGENYYGWIREDLIAYCEKEEMQAHYEALLTTENKNILVVTENVEYKPENNEVYPLRMGTKLFLETKDNGDEYVIVPV
ncbi:MAG: SH3 domain-containing protein, partial [Lachnospiraceae bacterium]|nr:SH3 domain-containing protein [Lachnospiraceae bacterium]